MTLLSVRCTSSLNSEKPGPYGRQGGRLDSLQELEVSNVH